MDSRIWNNFIPASLWLGYHLTVFDSVWSIVQSLMFLRAAVVFYFFLVRDRPLKRAPLFQIAVAWISTFVPVLMRWDATSSSASLIGELIVIAGTVAFIFSCIDLGRSFGVSPAIRIPVDTGMYRFFSHPLYYSHMVIEVGILIASPTAWNFGIVVIAWSFYFARAKWESAILISQTPYIHSLTEMLKFHKLA